MKDGKNAFLKISESTRDKINLLKAKMRVRTQDDVIRKLISKYGD